MIIIGCVASTAVYGGGGGGGGGGGSCGIEDSTGASRLASKRKVQQLDNETAHSCWISTTHEPFQQYRDEC